MPNCNTSYATLLVDELARAGLHAVCLAPGSRNTPLTLAFAAHPALRVSSHLDERSAAFFALGIALATDAPVALVCTSGSAGANFFPAVVEAHQAGVPLLVLTADRPHELRHSGANQTIDQTRLYGAFALWSVDAPLPEAAPSAQVVRSLRTLAVRALATAGGLRRGVVHINLPFRPPLEPTPVAGDLATPPPAAASRPANRPYTHMIASPPRAAAETLDMLATLINTHPHGLIVCGPRSPTGAFGPLVAQLAERVGYPALVDGVSGLRAGVSADAAPGAILGGYTTFLDGADSGTDAVDRFGAPDVVLRFGAVPTSKVLNAYLDRAAPPLVIHICASGVWADESHRLSHAIQADEAALIRDLLPALTPRQGSQSAWMRRFRAAEVATWEVLAAELEQGAFFDGAAVAATLDLLPAGALLFVGNSLAVRHVDQFSRPTARPSRVYANRGASGIDGNLSTALGLGYACPAIPLVAIVGDITFYHDMNGLLAVRRCGVPITIVLLHNDGGGIFRRLPISQFEPAATDYFVTPHGLDFAHAARLYGLDYIAASDRATFRRAFRAAVGQRSPTLIEVRSDAHVDYARWQAVGASVQARLQQAEPPVT